MPKLTKNKHKYSHNVMAYGGRLYEEQLPTYEQAIGAMKNSDDSILAKALFPFIIDDRFYLKKVTKAVKSLLDNSELGLDEYNISRAILGLERLPLRTQGLDIHFSVSKMYRDKSIIYEFYLSSDRFSTYSSSLSNSGRKSDSFTDLTFEVEPGRRVYSGSNIKSERWLGTINEMTTAYMDIIDDRDDSLIELDRQDGSVFWKWIAKHN
jgi:hypothetical protein